MHEQKVYLLCYFVCFMMTIQTYLRSYSVVFINVSIFQLPWINIPNGIGNSGSILSLVQNTI